MPNMTMCLNKACIKKLKCFRYTAIPDAYQSYATFYDEGYIIDLKEIPPNNGCQAFIDNEGTIVNPEVLSLECNKN